MPVVLCGYFEVQFAGNPFQPREDESSMNPEVIQFIQDSQFAFSRNCDAHRMRMSQEDIIYILLKRSRRHVNGETA